MYSFDDRIPDDTTLVKFRKRLGEEGFREIFNEIVKIADEAKQISTTRIIDGTHINAVGKRFGFIKFIREGINRVIKEVIIKNKEAAKKLKEKYQRIKIKTKRSAKKIGKLFIKEVEKLKEKSKKVKEIIKAMSLSIAGEPLANYTDTEARVGHKSKNFTWCGYKGEILVTEKGFITSFRVLPGNKNEGKDISPLIKDEKRRGLKIKEMIGDCLYPSAKNYEYLKKEKIKGYFPERTKKSKIDEFTILEDKIICPCGKEPIGNISQENGKLFYWSVNDCKNCPLSGRCVSPSESRKKVYLSDLKAMKIEERRDKLKKRSIVERIFAHGVNHGLRDSWYKGLNKATIHLSIIFTLLNLEYLSG
jgi:hypothetical protein